MSADSSADGWVRRDRLIGRAAALLAVGAVSLVALTVLALAVPEISERLHDRPPSYSEGDQIDLPASAYNGVRRTVFFFSRFSCQACQASQPTMAAVVERLSNTPDVRVIMVTGSLDRESETGFASGIGIDAARVLSTDMQALRLRYVPAVLITDERGRIIFAHEGLLAEDDGVNIVRVAASVTAN